MGAAENNNADDGPPIAPILRSIAVWLLIITAESLNGMLRELVVVPLIGNESARRVSFGVALILILSIATLFINWIRESGTYQLLLIGAVWAVLTICFEFVLGVAILGRSLEKFASDYNVATGGLMSLGLIFLIFVPLLASRLRDRPA
jgi:hypothetical protein